MTVLYYKKIFCSTRREAGSLPPRPVDGLRAGRYQGLQGDQALAGRSIEGNRVMSRAAAVIAISLFLAACTGPRSIQTTQHDPLWTTASDPYRCWDYPALCE